VSQWTYDSRRYRTALREVQATGPTCWLCGHPGSDSLDHVIPASVAPELAADPSNWRPSHGVQGWPTCGRLCNQECGTRMASPQTRRSRAW